MKIIDADKLHYKQVYIQTEKGLRPALVVFAKEIRKMPEIPKIKVQVDPVMYGHWEGKPIAGYSTVRCSECGEVFMENRGKWNFCPNCGAYMGAEDETD